MCLLTLFFGSDSATLQAFARLEAAVCEVFAGQLIIRLPLSKRLTIGALCFLHVPSKTNN